MLTNHRWSRSSRLSLWVGVGGVLIGTAVGILAGANPLYLGLALGAITIVVYFFASFEQAVLGLLILRSSLDVFTTAQMPDALQQIPAAFSVGLDGLTLLYVSVLLLSGEEVRTDRFWWFFASWIVLQGLWLILLPLGGLGVDASYLPYSIREWTRLFSFLMIYLLVMQLKDRLHPEKIISVLSLSLILPLTVAFMQTFLPSLLPAILTINVKDATSFVSEESRIRGTFGHPNSFAVYLLLFISLSWWKLTNSGRRWPWFILLSLLVFFLSTTKTMIILVMLATFVLVVIAPRLSILNLIGGMLLFTSVIVLFTTTEFGRQRLGMVANTPLLNPDMDVSRAILLSKFDNNSFNWRIAQWDYLLRAWTQYPIFGFGLGTSAFISANGIVPHNDYVRALVEGGIVGLATFLSFLGAQVVRLVQLLRATPRGSAQHELCLILLAVLVATLIGMFTENVWICTAFYFYWWTAFAVSGWNWNELQTSENSMPVSPLLRR